MDKTQLFALVAVALVSGGIVGLIDTEKPIYQCESKNLISNCNKLGANATRCYYNETAPLKYSFCGDGWHIIPIDSINTEKTGLNDVLTKDFNQKTFRCEVEGCTEWQ